MWGILVERWRKRRLLSVWNSRKISSSILSDIYWVSYVELARLKLVGERQLSKRNVGSENKDVCIYPKLAGMWEIFPWSLVDSLHRQSQVTGKMTRKLCPWLKANPSFLFQSSSIRILFSNLSCVFMLQGKSIIFLRKHGSYQNSCLENDSSVPFSAAVFLNTKGCGRVAPTPRKKGGS